MDNLALATKAGMVISSSGSRKAQTINKLSSSLNEKPCILLLENLPCGLVAVTVGFIVVNKLLYGEGYQVAILNAILTLHITLKKERKINSIFLYSIIHFTR